MLKPRWRKVLADLWEDKVRSVLVIASVAVGVFAVGMIAGTYVIISTDMNSSYSSANPANIVLLVDPFDDDFLKSVERLDGVSTAEGRWLFNARLKTSDDEWTSLDLVAVQDFENIAINKLMPTGGSTHLGNKQIILEDNTQLQTLKLAGVDRLEIELADTTSRELPVIGLAKDQTQGKNEIMGNVKGYITIDSLDWMHQPELYNRLYLTVENQPNNDAYIQQVADRVTDQVEKSGRVVYQTERNRSNQHPMDSIVQALLGVLFVLGILVVFLNGALISNTLSALLNQHLRQIGVMKLIGARQNQVVTMYLALILAYSLSALAIAIPLGAWAAYELSVFAAEIIGFTVNGFRIIPLAVILQLIIAILVPPLAGLMPVMNGARITVRKAIANTGVTDNQLAKSWLDRVFERIKGISRPMLISLRNTFRRKGRLLLTLFTLTLGGAIFIAVFNVQVALNDKVDAMTRYFTADVNLDFERDYRVEVVENHLGEFTDVDGVEAWVITGGELLNDDGSTAGNLAIFGPPADSTLVDPTILEGRWLLPDDEQAITVNEAFWKEYPDLTVGDTLRLKVDGNEEDWLVVGIFQFIGSDDYFAYASYDYLSSYIQEPNRASKYRIVSQNHAPESQQMLSAEIDQYFRDQGFHVSKVEAGSALVESIKEYIGVLIAILLIMAGLTALVGGIGLAGTLGMNVLERTREIGILRAIGAYNQVVMSLVVVEGLVVGLLSYFLAVLLSFPISGVLSDIVSLAIFNIPADFAFSLQGFGIWLGLVLFLSVVSSMIPARSASKMTIREVLAYE
jgi:putative ABC transport system permease protein